MTNFLAVTMFVVFSLMSGVAQAKGDGPEPISVVVSTGGMRMPGVEVMIFDVGFNFRLNNGHFKNGIKNDWNFTLTVGSDARLNSPTYRFERPILALDIKWQLGDVFAWRLTSRVVFGEVPLPGFFTGPSFTYARYDNAEFDLAILGGKYLFEPGGFAGENSWGAAMVMFRVLIGPS